jgi:hypothetical protein
MLKEGFAPLVKRMELIKNETQNSYLLWAYFDLVKDVLFATGLKEADGGDGKKYMLTMPSGRYDRMSFILGAIRVVGIGHQLVPDIYGITFIFRDEGIKPTREGWRPWRWGSFKRSEAIGKEVYLTTNPRVLLDYGEVRLKWMECVFNIAVPLSNNRITYGKHCPIIYHAAIDLGLRTLLFREAGIPIEPD